MKTERIIRLLEIENECVRRKSGGVCDGDCGACELAQDDGELKAMYAKVIAKLRASEPRVMGIDEVCALKGNDVAWVEIRDEYGTSRVLPGIFMGMVKNARYNETGDYVVTYIAARWLMCDAYYEGNVLEDYTVNDKNVRYWTGKPSEVQREAIAWKE